MNTSMGTLVSLARDIAEVNVAPNVIREFHPHPPRPVIEITQQADGLGLRINGVEAPQRPLLRIPSLAVDELEHTANLIFDWLWSQTKLVLGKVK